MRFGLVKFYVAAVCIVFSFGANAQAMQIQSARAPELGKISFDLFLSEKPGASTVIYLPGCNGRDRIGVQYQDFHVEKIKEQWGNHVNIVRVQIADDLSQGAENGVCFWGGVEDPRSKGRILTLDAALKTVVVQNWVSRQPWYNGQMHLFGFSWGGFVGLWIAGDKMPSSALKSVTLIWPVCIDGTAAPYGQVTLPTRIYATEKDPISEPTKCPALFTGNRELLELHLYPGNTHSWMTHPSHNPGATYWPNWERTSYSFYNRDYAERTWSTWVRWAKCLEAARSSECRSEVAPKSER